jgi:hypothetical protein
VIKTGEVIDLENINTYSLPVFTDEEASSIQNKGWNLPQVWDLVLLKTVYNTIINSNPRTKERLYSNLDQLKKPSRFIDEYWNALKCFGIVEYEKSEFIILKKDFFDTSTIDLTEVDLVQLKDIFFTYFRFKEIANWFLKNSVINDSLIAEITRDKLISSSSPIFGTSYHQLSDKDSQRNRKLTDTIFYDFNPLSIYQLSFEQDKIMRFFDIFINWGLKLSQIESINLTDGINVSSTSNEQKIKLYYFVNDHEDVDVKRFIEDNYKNSGRTISLPELTINLAFRYRCSLNKIHKEIIDQTANSNGAFSLQRTSKVFISKARDSSTYIRDREKLYPKLGNAFVSHLILR